MKTKRPKKRIKRFKIKRKVDYYLKAEYYPESVLRFFFKEVV